jgi:hypothetical protein
MTWLAHVLGLDSGSGYWYMWWSGVGSDLGELAIVGTLIAQYRRHACHIDHPRRCWRPGRHPVPGTPFKTCKRHHPHVPDRVSAEHVAAAAQQALPQPPLGRRGASGGEP